MEILNLRQGSDEWLDAKATARSASELPAAAGHSKYCSRDELIAIKASGITPDVSDYVQKFLFDKGHAIEGKARVFVEEMIGEELFPEVAKRIVDGVELFASFDGITMGEDIIFECKMLNAELLQMVQDKKLSKQYTMQMDQQLLVSEAEKCIFCVSDGTKENTHTMEYTTDLKVAEEYIPLVWKEFNNDVSSYKPKAPEPELQAKTIDNLPSISIQLSGSVTASNLDAFKSHAMAFVDEINTDLQTDQDFVDAEKLVKFCANAEKELEIAKKAALLQTEDIANLFDTIDSISESMREKRLLLSKSVKAKKTTSSTLL